jgi:flagellar M-ring protein FliF
VSRVALNGALGKAKGLMDGFTPGQKAVSGIAVLALVLGGVFFTSWARTPAYAPVFTNLPAADAAAITAQLDEDKQEYRLADGGQTVEVPRGDVYRVRINLSGEGLPSGGNTGYALMDEQGLTSSDFQQHVTYQRALEGELQKTIEAIDGVQAAIVHLVVPKHDVFSEDANKPSASVLVKSPAGKHLSSGQVQAVVHLVSSSVEGLTPETVTVADADGRVLNAPGEDGAAMDDVHSQQVKAYEDSTAQAVQSMLTDVVGAGHAVVRVDADLSYDQKQTTTEKYVTDEKAVPLQSSTTKETYSGAAAPVGGVLGPDNIGVPTGSGGSDSTYEKSSEQVTNAVGKVTEQTKAAPGQVRRQSVAVLLDAGAAGELDRDEVEKLVAAAAGIVPDRGDTIQVSTMSFDTTAAAEAKKQLEAEQEARNRGQMLSLGKTIALIVLVLVALAVLGRRSRRVERTEIELPAQRGEITVDDMRELMSAARELEGGLPALDPAVEKQHNELVAIRSDIGSLIEQQPDEVARLLRGWLADRRS